MRLSEVPVGAIAEVKKLYQSDISAKLRAVGILPGIEIEVVKAAPMGDPKIYKVFSKLISLRNSEAEVVEVEIIENQPLPATFVEPGKYKVVEIKAGRMARFALEKCGVTEGAIIEITPDKMVISSVGTFDIGFGRLSKVLVLPITPQEKAI